MSLVSARRGRLACALYAAAGLAALLSGCHGRSIPAAGTPVVTLSDVSGDFASYVVTLDSLTLTATDGSIASLLSNAEGVDLARLTEIPELLSAPAAASGTYVSATFTIDFSSAVIWYNNNGTPLACAPHDPSGKALSVATITVTFDPARQLVITPGKSTRLAFEIDLAASNSVNTSVSPCVVTVQPFLTARVAPADNPLIRARGLLVVTESNSSDFVMNTRPLYDLLSIGMGALTVKVGAQTYYNINGTAYTGSAGLDSMQVQGVNLPVAAYGTLGDLSGITPTFSATSVYAGTSLESPLQDHLHGVVAARNGNDLTLHGSLLVSRIGTISFQDSTAITLGPNTIVSQDGLAVSGLTAAALSVGQQVDISGTGSSDSAGAVSLDASAGQARLSSTRVWGTVNSASAGSLSLQAQTFGNYAASGLSFAGTGAGGQNADPAAYLVDTGALNESALAPGTLVAVDGIVVPFGAAPPDFTATAVTPGTSTPQKLVVEWTAGTAAPFTTLRPTELIVNLSNPDLSAVHYIATGPAKLDLKSLPASPVITTAGAPNQNDLVLAVGSTAPTGGISMFTTATAFATAANAKLNGTRKLFRLVAVGQYNSATNTFVASTINLALHE